LFLLVAVLVPELTQVQTRATDAVGLSWRGISSAAFVALFALQGFEVVGVPAGEAQSPEKKVPRAVLSTLLISSALYVVVQLVLVFGFAGLAGESDAPLADAALALSPSLGIVVAIGALISTLGFVSGSALGTPRYLFAMASSGQLPLILSCLHARFQTPVVAILLTSVIAAALVLPFDYRTLIGMSNVAVAVQYGATCVAVLRRGLKSGDGDHRNRRIILATLGTIVSLSIWFAATGQELMFAVVALIVGWAIMGLFAWRARLTPRAT
jgi:amino acid transporter